MTSSQPNQASEASTSVERTELLQPGPAIALSRLLDVPLPDLVQEGLPLAWHWVYLLERPATADLGRDGHPVRDAVPAPPGPGRRRMWAGGRLTSLAPLRVGEPATRRTSVLATADKEGRTGCLTFVTVGHEVWQRGQIVVRERQDIVYRDEAERSAGPAGQRAVTESDSGATDAPVSGGERSWDVSPPLLFRFSALTYNGHRIHYDRQYSQDVEGYPGLVTHGPLQALVMAEMGRAKGLQSGPTSFEYRLISPLFDHQGLVAGVEGETATYVRDTAGRRTAQGSFEPLT